jgi:alpha-beta hydrolase superfamily lysophospholipase
MWSNPTDATSRRSPRLLGVAAACAGLLVAACGGDASSPPDQESIATTGPLADQCDPENAAAGGPVPDFYASACPLEGGDDPGTLLAVEPIAEAPAGTSAWRALYSSTTLGDEPTVVSAIIVAPRGEAPPGGFPVVSLAHATTGVARECAPSIDPAATNGDVPSPTTFETVRPFVDAGYAVIGTDYRGLGTPGPHPYLVGVPAGRNVLDAARAMQGLPELDTSDDVLLYGHSQGGHAVAWARELAATYAPDLEIAGAVEAAPVGQIADLVTGPLEAAPPAGLALLVTLVEAWSRVYVEADPAEILTPEGQDKASVAFDRCLVEVVAAVGDDLEADDVLVDIRITEPWESLLAANTPGQVASDVPVLIVQGEDDPVVRRQATDQFVARLCDLDQVVEYLVYPGVTHETVSADSMPDALSWMAERRNGDEAPTSC